MSGEPIVNLPHNLSFYLQKEQRSQGSNIFKNKKQKIEWEKFTRRAKGNGEEVMVELQ